MSRRDVHGTETGVRDVLENLIRPTADVADRHAICMGILPV
jgi:hypothetical protein